MPDLFAGIKRFTDKLLQGAKRTQAPLVKLEIPPIEAMYRVPDHIDELVTTFRYMLARTDPNGRQCSCTGNTEVDRLVRTQFENIIYMIVDDRVRTALRNKDDRDRAAESKRGPKAS